jgi:hypothetical protein
LTAQRRWLDLHRINPKTDTGNYDPFRRQERRESRYFLADEFPEVPKVTTPYLAVSASLQHGPWGPDQFFRRLDGLTPVAYTDDGTIAIYYIYGTDLYRHWSPINSTGTYIRD